MAKLDGGLGRKLTLVSGPAGCGKTTLVSAWTSETNLPVAWLSLDESDGNLGRFLAYLIAALQMIANDLGDKAMHLLQSAEDDPPPTKSILTLLINEIAAVPTEFVLVLDDYHAVESPPVDQALEFLLDHLPPPMHLVIASRSDPSLPLSRLRGRSEMTELRANDLRFTREETAAFLIDTMALALSAEDVATLEGRTEGWIVGLQMAALSMQDSDDVRDFINSFTGSHRYVLDYLIDEVLRHRPPGTRNFLLQTAILERLSGPLCDAVTQGENSQRNLEALEAANLFIVPLDNERRWYRYHQLFRDLLRRRLQLEMDESASGLHRRAAEWFVRNGYTIEALLHAFAAEDMSLFAGLLEENAPKLLFGNDALLISDWLDRIPEEVMAVRPWLCIWHSWSLEVAGAVESSEGRLQLAEGYLASLEATESATVAGEARRSLAAHMAIIRANVALDQGDNPTALNQAQRALTDLPQESLLRAAAATAVGIASKRLGDLVAATEAYKQAQDIGRAAGRMSLTLGALCNVGATQALQGRLHFARQTYQEAFRLFDAQSDGRRVPVMGHLYLDQAAILYEWNDLDLAFQDAGEGLDIGRRFERATTQIDALILLTYVHQARGDALAARETCAEAWQLLRRSNVDILRRHRFEVCQVRLWLAQGDIAAVTRWQQETDLGVDDPIDFADELRHSSLARVLVARGSAESKRSYIDDALQLLARLQETAESGGWPSRVIEFLNLQALAHAAQGRTSTALETLQRALVLAVPEGFIRTFVDEGSPMGALLTGLKLGDRRLDAYAQTLLTAFAGEDGPEPPPLQSVDALSKRELEVLQLIAEGLTNPEISARLYIALDTVKSHNRNIFSKLGVKNRTQAIGKARSLRLLPL
jgi:LuxR family maltose regulon positive regulatory protein